MCIFRLVFFLLAASSIVFGYYVFHAVVCSFFIVATVLVLSSYLRLLRQAVVQRGKIKDQFTNGTVGGDQRNDWKTRKSNRKAEKTVLAVVVLMPTTALAVITFVIVFLTTGYDFNLAYVHGN